jgi:hypothetical protein
MNPVVNELADKMFKAFMRLDDEPRAPGEGKSIYLTEEEMNLLQTILRSKVEYVRLGRS